MLSDLPDKPVTQFLTRALRHLNNAYSSTQSPAFRSRIITLTLDLSILIGDSRTNSLSLSHIRSLFPPEIKARPSLCPK